MASLNQASLIGNVGSDPKVSVTQNGTKVVSFSLATTEKSFTTQQGVNVPERTEWHTVVLWRKLAEIAEKFVRKGAPVFVQGKIRYRTFDDKNGQKRYVTEIECENLQLLGTKPQAGQQHQQSGQVQQQPSSSTQIPYNAMSGNLYSTPAIDNGWNESEPLPF